MLVEPGDQLDHANADHITAEFYYLREFQAGAGGK